MQMQQDFVDYQMEQYQEMGNHTDQKVNSQRRKKKGLNPRNKKNLMVRNKSSRLFENDLNPVNASLDAISEKP